MPRTSCTATLFAFAVIACERTPPPIAQTQQLTPQQVATASASPDSIPTPASVVASPSSVASAANSNDGKPALSRNPEPVVPIYFRDVCEGEDCRFGEWLTCDTLRVLREPRSDAKTVFTLYPGDKYTAVTGDRILTEAGMVVFSRNVKIDRDPTHVQFTPADTLYPLVYDDEGFGSWYFRGKQGWGAWFFGDAEMAPEDIRDRGEGWRVVRSSQSEWWVKARAKDGREGWMIPGSTRGMPPQDEEPAGCTSSESE